MQRHLSHCLTMLILRQTSSSPLLAKPPLLFILLDFTLARDLALGSGNNFLKLHRHDPSHKPQSLSLQSVMAW